jgi:hypothetical protein
VQVALDVPLPVIVAPYRVTDIGQSIMQAT